MSKQFNQYREVTAKFDSVATCGHPIKQGDTIGYARGVSHWDSPETQCKQCWAGWKRTVALDNFDAAMMGIQ